MYCYYETIWIISVLTTKDERLNKQEATQHSALCRRYCQRDAQGGGIYGTAFLQAQRCAVSADASILPTLSALRQENARLKEILKEAGYSGEAGKNGKNGKTG